jgi:hypothetical protein
MDIAGDDTGIWLTYEALAVARDIQRDAARRLAQRHRWRRQTGNDGLARVLVPPEWVSTSRDIAGDDLGLATAQPDVVAPDVAGVVTALQGAIDTLRQQLVRADARSDEFQMERNQALAKAEEAREEAGAERSRADRAEQTVAAERRRAEVLRERLEATEAQARSAEQAADQARQHVREAEDAIAELRRADEARKARGRWTRLRAAWRGDR